MSTDCPGEEEEVLNQGTKKMAVENPTLELGLVGLGFAASRACDSRCG